jgi:hypothetical protein
MRDGLRASRAPEVFVELRPHAEGCYVRALIAGAPDRHPRVFVGVFGSRAEVVSEATGWGLGLLTRLHKARTNV